MRTPAYPSHFSVPNHEPLGPMKCAIFVVECLVNLASGSYALYTAASDKRIWTHNYGYEPGDEVWVYYREGSKTPEQIIVNRKEIAITK